MANVSVRITKDMIGNAVRFGLIEKLLDQGANGNFGNSSSLCSSDGLLSGTLITIRSYKGILSFRQFPGS